VENGEGWSAFWDCWAPVASSNNSSASLREPASLEDLLLVHSAQHVARVDRSSSEGGGWLDGDTVTSPESYESAIYAAGGTAKATEKVIEEDVESAFALVRPPGHHATRTDAMGFCLFNNVAIAARVAMRKHDLERVLIVDFDVHHGNGTQDVFYDDARVLYASMHQYPLYPEQAGWRRRG